MNSADVSLSVPVQPKHPPRSLTEVELIGVLRIADVLIPDQGELSSARCAPDFERWLERALAARPESFELFVSEGKRFCDLTDAEVDGEVRAMARDRPEIFQPVSAIIAGAYLMIPVIRKAIGYPGQHASRAPFDQAMEEITDGIMDPVLERGYIYTPVEG